jgi:SRSO17 transposase
MHPMSACQLPDASTFITMLAADNLELLHPRSHPFSLAPLAVVTTERKGEWSGVGPLLAITPASTGARSGCHSHALIDRELYLPVGWRSDRVRCREAAIPDEIGFRTKPELARVMLERALDAGVPCGWVTGDEVYGGDGRLRRWLEEREVPHVLAVKRSEALWSMRMRQERAFKLAGQLPARAWRRLSAGDGAKGPRVYAWARVAIRPLREPGRGHWLLVRRSLADGELAFYVCYGPAGTTLAELVRVAGTRWMVECSFQQAKGEVGLDHYQVRRWDAWYRHITLAMLANAFLAAMRAPSVEATATADTGGC